MTGQVPEWLPEVGEGWHPLLGRLHGRLLEVQPDYVVGQLTEKFGGLRVYLDNEPYDSEAWKLVRVAEVASMALCETCGQPGLPRTPKGHLHGWVKTMCDIHHAGRGDGAA